MFFSISTTFDMHMDVQYWNFTAPQYCSMKLSSQQYFGQKSHICPWDVTNSSSQDFCKIKSGCVNSSLWQQQSMQSGSHLNPSHWANSLSLGKSPHSWMICSIPLNYPGIIAWSRSQYDSWVWASANVILCIHTPLFWCSQPWLGFF